jgi:Na+-translocating ferredoxin:NAD+ oxidoreductase RNF subunit RnfB
MKAKRGNGEGTRREDGALLTLRAERCAGCTHCLRVCPTEAIRIRGGKAEIMARRCILCGECLRACPREAWAVPSEPLEQILAQGPALSVLDPAVFGQFGDRASPGNILGACVEIGFSAGRDMGEGIALYREAVAHSRALKKVVAPAVSSDCPAVVQLVQVKFPSLLENLVPVAPPFEIMAQRLKRERDGDSPRNLCYVVPCPAKAWAAIHPLTPEGAYHRAIPLADLYNPLQACLHGMPGVGEAGETVSGMAMEWAFPGGEGKALGTEVALTVDGIHRVAEVLELAENGLLDEVPFIEAWSCPGGCLGGCLNVRNPFWARFQLSSAIRRNSPPAGESRESGAKKGEAERYVLHQPFLARAGIRLDEDLQTAMEKLRRIDETVKRFPGIDCGSCGSPHCLALAEDVVQGNARETDCLYRLKRIKPDESPARGGASGKKPSKSKRKRR